MLLALLSLAMPEPEESTDKGKKGPSATKKKSSSSDSDKDEDTEKNNKTENKTERVARMLATYIADDLDKGIMADFISTNEYVMGAFRYSCFTSLSIPSLLLYYSDNPIVYNREVVESNSVYDILKVEGDGNCFFRAVIKYHFPDVPRD